MLKGSIVALVTPFSIDGTINYLEVDRLLELHLDNKTDGILLLGTTAESEALSKEEKIELVKYVLNYLNNRIPVMVGVIGNNFNYVKDLISVFNDFDIDSLLVVCPYYVKANNSGIIKYFTRLADYSKHPIVIYNVPKRTGFYLNLDVVKSLSFHPNIIGIKEASGDLNYQTKLSSFCSEKFVLYGGDDVTVLSSLALGAKGIISVINNAFPKEFKLIIDSFYKDINISRTMFNILLPLMDSIYLEVSPIGIKYLLFLLGFDTNRYRLPLDEASKEVRRKIEENLISYLGE